MSHLYNVSTSPHDRSSNSTRSIMLDVAIALFPATLFGVYNFGIKALLIVLTCIVTCILTEYIYEKLMKRPITVSDGSAVVTGILIALNMPSTLPLWIPMLGCIFAILVVKQIFGGLGQNFMNPALAARCFLLISFTSRMTIYPVMDSVSGATPLADLRNGVSVDVAKMFMGTTSGSIGETSVIAILLGAIYLLAKKIISIRIPAAYIGSFVVFLLLFGKWDATYILTQLFGGGLMLGAFFMATDYVTSPITKKGKLVFGILLGLLTAIFRVFGGSAEGVSYAILLGNLLVPLIERVTMPVAFGKGGKKNG